MVQLSSSNAKQLGTGSLFLGSGGGDSFSFTQSIFETQVVGQGTQVIDIDTLDSNTLVAPMVCLGNDIVLAEKNYNLSHFEKLFKKIETTYDRKVDVIAALSVGGGTVFAPAFVAFHLNVPILDADCFGRTLPELQMMSTNLADIKPKKAFIANLTGGVFEVECDNFYTLERYARQIAVSSGGLCMAVPQILTGEEAKRGLIPGTLTQALTIGQIIQETRDLNAVMEYTKGTFVGIGGIMSATGLGLPHPFKRRIIIKNAQEGRTWEVWMDNEFNLLFENGELIAEVPDIITLCNPYTCEPLTIRQLTINNNVAICTMKAPDIWYTEKGLALCRTKEHEKGRDLLFSPSSSLQKTA